MLEDTRQLRAEALDFVVAKRDAGEPGDVANLVGGEFQGASLGVLWAETDDRTI